MRLGLCVGKESGRELVCVCCMCVGKECGRDLVCVCVVCVCMRAGYRVCTGKKREKGPIEKGGNKWTPRNQRFCKKYICLER